MTLERKYIPYSSWDDVCFWIGIEVYGRDFRTFQEAWDYGCVKFYSSEQEERAYALYQKQGALTYEELMQAV